jgi:hypothetical protein
MARTLAALLLILFAAALWAQDKNQPRPSSARPAAHPKPVLPDPGAISDGVYHNFSFGLNYKLPFGWVDRTAEMQDDSADTGKSRLLLAIFERPPEATGDTVNSAVVIAAEPLYAGMKTAPEYLESLSALATAKGFEAKEEPRKFSMGTTELWRADFSKTRGTLTMYQTSLATLEKGYAISFTFIGGSEDEVNELIEKLSFAPRKPAR